MHILFFYSKQIQYEIQLFFPRPIYDLDEVKIETDIFT